MPAKRRHHPDFGNLLEGFVEAELARAHRQLGRQADRLNLGIHQGRKSLRRCRAALAFGASVPGFKTTRLDRALRAVCRSLSHERDAQAVTETLKRIAAARESGIEAGDAKHALRLLKVRRDRILASRLLRDPELSALRRRLARIAEGVERLPWRTLDVTHVGEALARSLKRCAKAEKQALRGDADAEALHRWRRRLRRLRQQISALEKLTGQDWSKFAAVPDPADALSEARDVAGLVTVLKRLPGLDRNVRRRLLTALSRGR